VTFRCVQVAACLNIIKRSSNQVGGGGREGLEEGGEKGVRGKRKQKNHMAKTDGSGGKKPKDRRVLKTKVIRELVCVSTVFLHKPLESNADESGCQWFVP
jgi:hypothetical protein